MMADTPDNIAGTVEGGGRLRSPLLPIRTVPSSWPASVQATTGLSLENTAADGLMVTPMEKPLQFEEYVMAAD